MARPDLNDADARAEYRRELRTLHGRRRLVGFTLVLAGAWLVLWPRMNGPWMLGPLPSQYWGWGLLGLGWAVLISVIVARTRYHKARMDEPDV